MKSSLVKVKLSQSFSGIYFFGCGGVVGKIIDKAILLALIFLSENQVGAGLLSPKQIQPDILFTVKTYNVCCLIGWL